MLSVFSLLLFVFLLMESFLGFSVFLGEEFVGSSEVSFGSYVFSHSYQNEMLFWV